MAQIQIIKYGENLKDVIRVLKLNPADRRI